MDIINSLNKEKKDVDQELVILNQVLQAEVNNGYESFGGEIVKKVNGVEVKNLKHLIQLLKENQEPYQEILLSSKNLLVLDKEAVENEGAEILARYDISSAFSDNLQ